MQKIGFALISMLIAGPVAASDFQRIEDRGNFVSLIEDKDLTRFGIRLNVTQDGKISGRAFGKSVSGAWQWNRGYFCRDLFVDGEVLDSENCQTVQVRGNTLRFTSDMGRGDSADLRLK